jgi:hypothetical protein
MGGLSAVDVLDRLAALGCAVRVEGERLKVRGPDLPEVAALIPELSAHREEAMLLIRELRSAPPTLGEIEALLPESVRVLRYEPKPAPFAVAPVSVVTNAGKFFQAYLKDLAWRMEHPEDHAAPSLADILAKLADAGLDLMADGSSFRLGEKDQPCGTLGRKQV